MFPVTVRVIIANVTNGNDTTEKMSRRLSQHQFCMSSIRHPFIRFSYIVVICYLIDQTCSITLLAGFFVT